MAKNTSLVQFQDKIVADFFIPVNFCTKKPVSFGAFTGFSNKRVILVSSLFVFFGEIFHELGQGQYAVESHGVV